MPSPSYNSKKGSGSRMLSAVQRSSLEASTARYEAALPGTQTATYLAARGIDLAVAATCRLGAVEEPTSGHEQFRGWLSIPFLTPSGVVAIKFRRLDDGTPKYGAPVGQKGRMFNVLAFREQEHSIAIAEGEIDALTLHHLCGIPAVGIPGVQSWRDWYPRCFEGFEEVIIVGDNDQKESGENPGLELTRKIMEQVPQARRVVLPPNTDANAFYLKHGREALRDLIFS